MVSVAQASPFSSNNHNHSHIRPSSQTHFSDLPPRPPTPPRESEHPDSVLPTSRVSNLLSKDSDQHSPLRSRSFSAIESSKSRGNRLCKKVEWSDTTDYEDSPRILTKSKSTGTPTYKLRSLPPSSDKPVKSILKPYDVTDQINQCSTPPLSTHPPSTPSTFVKMLDAVVTQLMSEDTSSRIDGYLTLNGVLKASEHIPDTDALKRKLDLISRSILKDATSKSLGHTTNTALAINALTLLASLLYRPKIAVHLSNDFCTKFIEFAISAFASSIASKDIIKHLMWIVDHQSFSKKVMTSERLARLLASLQDIELHTKGRSIVLGRMVVYQKILQQNRQALIDHLSWIEHLLRDMLSSLKDVRTAAIAWGLEAAQHLGTERYVSWAVSSMLDKSDPEVDGGRAYFDLYSSRMSQMVADKKDAIVVPQIWSVIVLFFRSRPEQLEKWKHMRSWLCNIQECFNCGDYAVKKQANVAWSRFILAVFPSEGTSEAMIKMLCQPLHGQLRRKIPIQHVETSRGSTMATICSLLYYSLRPSATHTLLDRLWDAYVIELVANTLIKRVNDSSVLKDSDVSYACLILKSLFDNNRQITWSKERALIDRPIEIGELPALDPRWLRSNASRVFDILEPLLETSLLDLASPTSPVSAVWHAFLASIRSAGEKEVKVSDELMIVMSSLFTCLSRLWYRGPAKYGAEKSCEFVAAVVAMVNDVVRILGQLPFTEKLLCMSQPEIFLVVATPTHRPAKMKGQIRSPFHHLITLMSQPSPGMIYSDELCVQLDRLVEPFFVAKKSKSAQLELAVTLSQLLDTTSSSTSAVALWVCIAKRVTNNVSGAMLAHNNVSGSFDQPLGVEYRHLCKILCTGFTIRCKEIYPSWSGMFDAAALQVTRAAGEPGCAIALIDPLAKLMNEYLEVDKLSTCDPAYLATLLHKATYPRDRQAAEGARRRLWGAWGPGQRAASYDPYTNLYSLTTTTMTRCYDSFLVDTSTNCALVFGHIGRLMQGCPVDLILEALLGFQHGVVSWIRDTDSKLKPLTVLYQSIRELWMVITSTIGKLPQIDSAVLRRLSVLICAGLESEHKAIAGMTAGTWNMTFGGQDTLDYPVEVEKALRGLRSIADLRLPGLSDSFPDSSVLTTSFVLEASQLDMDNRRPPLHSTISSAGVYHNKPDAPSTKSNLVTSSVSNKRQRSTPDTYSKKRRRTGKSVTPKLRHNDSQVQFEAVASSPSDDRETVSQILTDRQKEVRERQQGAAGILSDIWSSPQPQSQPFEQRKTLRSKNATVLDPADTRPVANSQNQTPEQRRSSIFEDTIVLTKTAITPTTPNVNHSQTPKQRKSSMFKNKTVLDVMSTTPTTPTVNDQTIATFDDKLDSSPTPRRGTTKALYDSDIPSSPPVMPTTDVSNPIPPPSSPLDFESLQDGWNNVSSPQISTRQQVVHAQPYAPIVKSPLKITSTVTSLPVQAANRDSGGESPSLKTGAGVVEQRMLDDWTPSSSVSSPPTPSQTTSRANKMALVNNSRPSPPVGGNVTLPVGAALARAIRSLQRPRPESPKEVSLELPVPRKSPAQRELSSVATRSAHIDQNNAHDNTSNALPLSHPYVAGGAKKTPANRVLEANKLTPQVNPRVGKSSLQTQSIVLETPNLVKPSIGTDNNGVRHVANSTDIRTPVIVTALANESVIMETIIKPGEVRSLEAARNAISPQPTSHRRAHSTDERSDTTSTSKRSGHRKRKRSIDPSSEIADSQDKNIGVAHGAPNTADMVEDSVMTNAGVTAPWDNKSKRLKRIKKSWPRAALPQTEEEMLQSSIQSQQSDEAEEDMEIDESQLVQEQMTNDSQNTTYLPSNMRKVFSRVEIKTPAHFVSSSKAGSTTSAIRPPAPSPEHIPDVGTPTQTHNTATQSPSQSASLRGGSIISLLSTAIASLKRSVLSKGQATEVDSLMYELRGEIWDAEKRGREVEDVGR